MTSFLPCDTAVSEVLAFLRGRPAEELVVRQCGELVEKNASRILYETIEANKANNLLQIKATNAFGPNGQPTIMWVFVAVRSH